MTGLKHTKAMWKRGKPLRILSFDRVVEAQDVDGIGCHPEEQLNPNRSSVPRWTSRSVAQLIMYPCLLCGAWENHLRICYRDVAF